jgi:hypothetical protein
MITWDSYLGSLSLSLFLSLSFCVLAQTSGLHNKNSQNPGFYIRVEGNPSLLLLCSKGGPEIRKCATILEATCKWKYCVS